MKEKESPPLNELDFISSLKRVNRNAKIICHTSLINRFGNEGLRNFYFDLDEAESHIKNIKKYVRKYINTDNEE